MTDPKTAAREVSGRLAAHAIRVKHVQALDLVAAGCGFQDRSKLTGVAELPKLRSVNARLLTSAATALALHNEDRRNTIISVTSDVLLDRKRDGIDLSPLVDALTGLKAGIAEDERTVPSVVGWISELMDLAESLPKRGGRPEFAFTTPAIAEWDSPFGRRVRELAEADEATTPFTALVDSIVRVIEEEDGDQLGFSEEEDVAEGEKPIDYDRIAAILEPVLRRPHPMGPLEVALRDGAGRAAPYAASLSEDRDTAGGAVRSWLSAVDDAFRFGSTPSIDVMRGLLAQGGEAVHGISHWLPADERLRAWIDVADHPGILDNDVDPEASGILGLSFGIDGGNHFLTQADVVAPDTYLMSPRAERLVEYLTSDAGSIGWSHDRSSLEESTRIAIASEAFEKLRKAENAEQRRQAADEAIKSQISPTSAEDDWYQSGDGNADRILDALEEAAEDARLEFDLDAWRDALQNAYVRKLEADDDSTPIDAIPPREHVEVMFFLHAPEDTIDEMCTIRGPWPEAKAVMIDDEFVFALSRLGISKDEWRNAVGSEGDELISRTAPAVGERLLTPEEMAVLVENGCTQNFCVVVYGIVDLKDVLGADLSKPTALSNASIAVYNQYSGTFFDKRLKRDVVVQDGVDGSWQTTDVGYSPKDICGMVEECYLGRLFEPEAAARATAATAALDARLAIEGLRRNQPGIQVHWKASDDGLVLEASAGTEDPARGYAMRRFTAVFESAKSSVPEVEIHPK